MSRFARGHGVAAVRGAAPQRLQARPEAKQPVREQPVRARRPGAEQPQARPEAKQPAREQPVRARRPGAEQPQQVKEAPQSDMARILEELRQTRREIQTLRQEVNRLKAARESQ
ncbi:MAG TPA: hypothetical protein VM098_02905 [Phycisphaerae bacterium]|nr:hypothetical protein [Phycisphaerae bacterium]